MKEAITALRAAIEHTILKPDTSASDIERICAEAIKQEFKAVCVPPYYIDDAVALLADTGIEIATVVGFPMGYQSTMSKFEEAEDALAHGVDHLDVVVNIAAVKCGDWDTISNEMELLTKLAHREGKVIKWILETGLLSEIEIDLLCKLANDNKVDYVKTSTGMNGPGATPEVVAQLRKWLSPKIKIKASGGIRTLEEAAAVMAAGANKIGTSSGVAIMEETLKLKA